MKTLITGIAGTGKSTITKILNEKGITAIDLHDIPDLFYWQDVRTKEVIEYSPNNPKDWFDNADRVCDIEKLKKLIEDNPNAVLAGSTGGSNQKEFLALFDKVILLQSSPQVLTHRLQTRTNKSGFGKSVAEQQDNIEWQKEFDPLVLSFGAIPVSTEEVADDTVSKIINIINQ